MPRTNLAVKVAGAVFGIAGEMRRLPAYFDSPEIVVLPLTLRVEIQENQANKQ